MNKPAVAAICVLIISIIAAPAFCGVAYKKSGTVYRIGSSVYSRSANFVSNTETHLTGVAKNVFSLFNPCLDLVKSCSSLVMAPVDIPVDYMAKAAGKRRGYGSRIPVPKKPTIPKK
jgi:hypothetical protein